MRTLRGVAVAAAAVAAATVTSGCNVTFSAETHRETRSHTLSATFTKLRVSADDKVEVVGTDTPRVRIVEYLSWSNPNNKPRTTRTLRDGTLTLETKCSRVVIGFNGCGAGYRVEVPRATAVDLEAEDASVRVSGLTGDSMRLHSDSGSVIAENIRTKALTVSVNSGGLKVSGHAERAVLRSDSGSVQADGLAGRYVKVRANSGSVRVGLTTVPDNVDIDNDSGSVRLTLPVVDRGYAFTLRTDSGGRTIAPALRRNDASPHRVKVTNDSGAIDITAASAA
mgnify:CR=1 FL=1